MKYDVEIPGRPFPWTQVGTLGPAYFERGETVTIGFLDRSGQIPIILTQKPWPSAMPKPELSGDADWWRLGARFGGMNSLGHDGEGVEMFGAVPAYEDWIDGGPLRSFGGRLVWADGTNSKQRLEGGGDVSSVDHGGEVISVWSDGEHYWALAMTDTTPAGYEEGYEDGYDAAAEAGADLYGAEACINELPYNPSGSNPGVPETSGTDDYLQGFEAGWNTGWEDLYRAGYEANGCIVTEE